MTKHKTKINEKGLKMGWIAKQLNIPQSTLSTYVNGTRTMPSNIEFRLNKILSN